DAREFDAHKNAVLIKKTAIPAPPPAPAATPTPSVTATSYLEIAQKMLWSRDRNSQVIVDPPKPPDPPKPLPPLPTVSGVMDIGDGPIVVMSEKQNATSRGVRPGDMIGEFKLVAVSGDAI